MQHAVISICSIIYLTYLRNTRIFKDNEANQDLYRSLHDQYLLDYQKFKKEKVHMHQVWI